MAFFFLFFLHGTSIGNGQQGISYNVPTLVDGGVCGLVDSATSYKRVLVAGRILNIN